MNLIKNWEELSKLKNEKYKIEVDFEFYSGWIVPIEETKETEEDYYEHHHYLSTHTFYGKFYKMYTEILQSFGFDVELDNWDKEK